MLVGVLMAPRLRRLKVHTNRTTVAIPEENIMVQDNPRYSADEEEAGHIFGTTDSGEIWRQTFMMAGVSLVVNLALYFIGTAAGWIPDDMPASTETFGLVSVILASVIPVLLFGVLMNYLGQHAPRASRLFTIILLVVLIIAVMVPFTLQDIDDSFRYLLLAMHIVTTACIFALTRIPEN